MKKGLSYVDVAISVGIFIVGITIAIALIKPLIKQENTGYFLFPVLRSGFENATYWTIYRYPFFLNTSVEGEGGYEVQVPFNFSSENINLTDNELNYIPFKYKKITDPGQYQKDFNISFTLIIEPIKKNLKLPFYLLRSKEFNYNVATFITSPNPVSISERNYTFGLRDELIGLSTKKFKNLQQYESMKKQFKISQNNDFSILIFDALNNQLLMKYPEIAPGEEDTVFTLQYSSFILYDNSTRKPILITLIVW